MTYGKTANLVEHWVYSLVRGMNQCLDFKRKEKTMNCQTTGKKMINFGNVRKKFRQIKRNSLW